MLPPPLYFALLNRHFDAARWLLEHGATLVGAATFVLGNNVEAMELLFEFGHRFSDNIVLSVKSLEMAKLLGSHGYIKPEENLDRLFACNLSRLPLEITKFYIANGFKLQGDDNVFNAIQYLNIEFLKCFVNDFDFALLPAAVSGDTEKIEFFYSHDQINRTNWFGRNPLMVYVSRYAPVDVNVVKLLRSDIAIQQQDEEGETAASIYLHMCVEPTLEVFEMLFDNSTGNIQGILDKAALKQLPEIVEYIKR